MNRNVTMKDIADRLNIDRTTVSRALAGSSRVSPKTIERVKQVAEELGYRKDRFASGLMTGKNTVLGIIIPEINRGVYAQFVERFQQVAKESGYAVILYYANQHGNDVLDVMQLLKEQRVSGATFISDSTDKKHNHYLIELVKSGMAINTTRRTKIHENMDSIQFRNHKAAYDLTQYLIGLGHTRIVFVNVRPAQGTIKEREDGYIEAMKHAGLQPLVLKDKISWTSDTESDQVQFSYHLLNKKWSTLDRPSCFIGVNDSHALGILFFLKEQGLSVPEEVSVAGFDNLYAGLAIPRLTSMRMPTREAGEWAAKLLIKRIKENMASAQEIGLDYELVERESVAAYNHNNLKKSSING